MCLTWLYKVTLSLNSFLNRGLQWNLLLKEGCCNSCTCSDSLAEMRQLCWSIQAHNSSFLLGKGAQLYQGNFQARDKVRCCLLNKISQDLLCLLCHCYSCKPRGRELGLSLPLSEGAVWLWGLSPHCYYPTLPPFLALVSKEPVKEIWEWAGNFLGMPQCHLTHQDFAL